jgi:hypothetical protein
VSTERLWLQASRLQEEKIAAETAASRKVLGRGALGLLDYFVNRRGKLIHARARNNDGITATVCFLGNAKEFSAIILAEFHVKMLALDLHLPRLDEIIHI